MNSQVALIQGATRGDKMTPQDVSGDYFEGKVSAYTVRDLWRRGELPGCKLGGRLIFSRSELDRWFAEKSRANMERQEPQQHGIRAVKA